MSWHAPLGRYVPWATWDEWITTYRWLYSSDESQLAQALHTVDVWRIRGRVPMAVDATATLRRISRLDEGGTLDAQTMRLQYSLAIVRFVNGVTDAAQKGRVAASVAGLALQAGVPRLLVDIRHESTHNELPTIGVLRLAAEQALEWLQQWYWEAQRAGVVRGRERVFEVVRAYVQSHSLASMKEVARNASGDGKQEGEEEEEEEDGVGGRARKKKKKKADSGKDRLDDGAAFDSASYCPRREKKNRHALLNELRGMLAVGGEALLARGLGSSGVAGLGEVCAERTCRRVLKQLGDVWPDLAATVLAQRLEALFLACLEEMKGGDGNTGRVPGVDDACWYRAAVAVLHDGCVDSIESIVDECVRRHCPAFHTAHQTAFIEVRADGTMEAGLARLRLALGELGDRPPAILQHFISLFLDATSIDANRLQRMRACVDDWTRGQAGQEETQKNTSGWTEVGEDSWRPCAIGMVPSKYLSNGSLPDLVCCGLNRSQEEHAWTAVSHHHPAVVLPAPDRYLSASAATVSRLADDTGGSMDTDDGAADGVFFTLPPPPSFSPD